MSLKLNSSGGGSVTLQEPVTASTLTLNLPAFSGTAATLASVTNNGVLFVNGSGQPTSGSALQFDGASLRLANAVGTTANGLRLDGGAQAHYWYLSDNTTSAFEIGSSAGQWKWLNSNGELMRLTSTGLGIGTSSPSGRVHAVSAPGTVQVKWSDATNGTANLDTASGLSRIWTNVGLAFGTGAETFTERARIDTSGRLLVGCTSPLGSARFTVEADTSASINPMAVSNSRSTAATDYSILFYRNASLVGSVQTSLSATSYVTSSDYRLKEEIAPMTGALAKVAALKPVTYKWKSTGESANGFIAHELAEVCPDAVTGIKDDVDASGNPKYQGIDTSFLVATLTAAIQEQQAMIAQLQADIASLKGTA